MANERECFFKAEGRVMSRSFFTITILFLTIVATSLFPASADEIDVSDWTSVEIFSNKIFTARCVHKPVASLADKHCVAFEIRNLTDKPLEVSDIWIGAEITISRGDNDEPLGTTSLGGKFSYKQPVPARGRRLMFPGYVSNSQSSLPDHWLNVRGKLRYMITLANGKLFETQPDSAQAKLEFQWRPTTITEQEAMLREVRSLLKDYEHHQKNYLRIYEIMLVPAVKEKLTVKGDFLPALKKSDDFDVRSLLLNRIFPKHANDSEVIAYYREQFQKNPEAVYWDAHHLEVWNDEFLEPLVSGCEKENWNFFWALCYHKSKWQSDPVLVKRISVAFAKHNPVFFSKKLEELPQDELVKWCSALNQVFYIGDRNLIKPLIPALSIKRVANTYSTNDLNGKRVCDRAFLAIVRTLDGENNIKWFVEEGFSGEELLTFLYNPEENYDLCDQAIIRLKKRLETVSYEK